MNPLMLLSLFQGAQSGALDNVPGIGPLVAQLKTVLGQAPSSPADTVNAALAVLAQHCPSDPAQAQAYADAIAGAVKAAVTLKSLVK